MGFSVNSTAAYAGRQSRRFGRLVDAWIPSRCGLCGAAARHLAGLCASCDARLPWMQADVCCRTCGMRLTPVAADVAAALPPLQFDLSLCAICDYETPPIDRLVSAFHYRSPLDMWVPQLKFHGNLPLARLLGELFAREYARRQLSLPQALIPLPLHRSRLGERGYDQPLELCRPIADALGIPLLTDVLVRSRATRRQSEMNIEQRATNLEGAFTVNLTAFNDILPTDIAIFDDVFTTGATLNEAALALRTAGIASVQGWVIAHTD